MEASITDRSIKLTQVSEWKDGQTNRCEDSLAVEEPLEIRISQRNIDSAEEECGDTPISVTMRTPGDDDELAVGFLWTEGIIETVEDIAGIRQRATTSVGSENSIEIALRSSEFDATQLQRNFFAASSCGICGKASIDAIRRRGLFAPNPDFRFDPDLLCELPEKLRSAQNIFGQTGGLHAAALFDADGNLLVLREDIGRHNAVDKIAGWALLQGRELSHHVLLVSGRGGFEIVQKTLAMRVPILASVSAPSSLAVQLARELGLTLAGFLRGRRFVVYAGQDRLMPKQIR